MIDEIPVEVRDYLTAGDGLAQAAVIERYPDVRRSLESPDVRAAILRYLASGGWRDPGFAINALAYLQGGASAKEVPAVRDLMTHRIPGSASEPVSICVGVYYPAQDRVSMVSLFETMLNDKDEIVRVQGARWIRDFKAAPEMQSTLQNWLKIAAQRKWDGARAFRSSIACTRSSPSGSGQRETRVMLIAR